MFIYFSLFFQTKKKKTDVYMQIDKKFICLVFFHLFLLAHLSDEKQKLFTRAKDKKILEL